MTSAAPTRALVTARTFDSKHVCATDDSVKPLHRPADGADMRALSIRQPYAELILRGIKTAELRSMSTTIVGERDPEVRSQRSEVRRRESERFFSDL